MEDLMRLMVWTELLLQEDIASCWVFDDGLGYDAVKTNKGE